MDWKEVYRVVYLTGVGVGECRIVRILVLLAFIFVVALYSYQGLFVNFYMPFGQWVISKDEQIRSIE